MTRSFPLVLIGATRLDAFAPLPVERAEALLFLAVLAPPFLPATALVVAEDFFPVEAASGFFLVALAGVLPSDELLPTVLDLAAMLHPRGGRPDIVHGANLHHLSLKFQ